MKEQEIHNLDMLEVNIARMADNSFKVKNWAIVTFAGLLSIYFTLGRKQILFVGCVVAVMFYILDAFYLSVERCFRNKYSAIVRGENHVPFDMTVSRGVSQVSLALKSVSMIPYWAMLLISGLIMFWTQISNFLMNLFSCVCGG